MHKLILFILNWSIYIYTYINHIFGWQFSFKEKEWIWMENNQNGSTFLLKKPLKQSLVAIWSLHKICSPRQDPSNESKNIQFDFEYSRYNLLKVDWRRSEADQLGMFEDFVSIKNSNGIYKGHIKILDSHIFPLKPRTQNLEFVWSIYGQLKIK